MARPRKTDKNPNELTITAKISREERFALEALAKHHDRKLADKGYTVHSSGSSIIRTLIRQAAIEAFGQFPVPATEQEQEMTVEKACAIVKWAIHQPPKD